MADPKRDDVVTVTITERSVTVVGPTGAVEKVLASEGLRGLTLRAGPDGILVRPGEGRAGSD